MIVRFLRQEKAASLVEFALIFPILAVLTLGVVTLGRTFPAYLVLMDGAREGAYHLAGHPDDATGAVNRTRIVAQRGGINPENLIITATTGAPGQIVSMRVQFDFDLLFDLLPVDPLTLNAIVSMEAF